jgi:pilus assembly protein CpaE
LANSERRRVLLMDGCLGFCTADVALDIESKKTIFDLVVDNDGDLDPDLIDRVVVHHSSGIDVLLAPSVESMLVLAPAQLQRILAMMRRLYEYIFVDTRPLLDETTIAFLDLSDTILTVCNPEIASLRNLRIFLDSAAHLGYGSDKIRLIINRADMRGAIPIAEIEKVCRYHVTQSIPNDHEAVASSINHGQPLVSTQPQRPISREITRLASHLTGSNNGHSTEVRSRHLIFTRLLGRGGSQH